VNLENQIDRSYRALLAVPSVGRLLLGQQIARIAQSMLSIAIVLFTLASYRSASLAGLATFFAIFPGLIVSPIAGALLDRHGRTRLVVLDYLAALVALTLLGILGLTGALPAWLLIIIVAVASLTAPLSSTGLRSFFPLIVPSHLWERVNAVDSMGYVFAAVIGPPLAAGIVGVWGGAVTFILIGLSFGLAALVIAPAPDPPSSAGARGTLLSDAWQGVIYTWRNRTLRGLGFSIAVANLIWGALTIVIPLIILERLHLDEIVIGFVFAVQGLTGIVSAVIFGRMDSRNRERVMLAVPMVGTGLAVALLMVTSSLPVVIFVMAVIGVLTGPLDIALFTLRQRRTDTRWTGRAFAVSMSFNYSGIPVGSVIAGIVAAWSIEAALAFGVVTSLLGALLVIMMIPATE
jgi:MFS family permease